MAWTLGLCWARSLRVLRCDGVVPQYQLGGREGGPGDIRALRGWLAERGARPDLDIVAEGETPADDPQSLRLVLDPHRHMRAAESLSRRSFAAACTHSGLS